MVAIRVTGAKEIAAVAAHHRALGPSRVVVNTMARKIKQGVGPIRAAIKARAVEILPSGGGLGKWVARVRITGVVRRGATTAGVSIRAGRNSSGWRSDIKGIDRGSTRHPTWGRAPWHAQVVRPGFFTDAVTEEGLDQLEAAVIEACEEASVKVLYG